LTVTPFGVGLERPAIETGLPLLPRGKDPCPRCRGRRLRSERRRRGKRGAPDGAGGLRYDATWWPSDALDDLAWLQRELSEDVLNFYEREAPGTLQGRAAYLVEQARQRGLTL
jgi:hypothetical protein